MFEYVPGAVAEDRASMARAALARAELAAGLRTRLTGPGLGGQTEGIELPAGLGALFPGGLAAGSVVGVRGSASILHTLVAAAMGEKGWAAVVGARDVGWVAAAEAGVDLARVVAVPAAGPAASDVVAACIDGFDVVALDTDLGAGAQRSLAGRARSNGTVVLTSRPWHGAPVLHARVRGGTIGPDGLTERVITVEREGSPTSVVVWMGTVPHAVDAVRDEAGTRHLRVVAS